MTQPAQGSSGRSGGWSFRDGGEASSREGHRRDETAIIYDILLAAREPASKTRIVYRCNLNFVKAQRLLDQLLAAALLAEEGEPGRTRYRTTPQGTHYLHEFEILLSLRGNSHVSP